MVSFIIIRIPCSFKLRLCIKNATIGPDYKAL
jgi:hypothetical protein